MQSIPQTTTMTQPTVQIPTQSDFSRVYEANLQRVENTVTKAIDSIALDIRELKQQDAAVKQLYEERFRRLEDNINDTKRAVYVQQDNNRRYQETVDKQIESFKELMLKESERNDERALEQSEKADRNLKWLMGIIISIAGIGGGSGVAIVSQALEMMP